MKKLPQCCFLYENGKRCRKRSAFKNQLHLNAGIYEYPAWVEVNLCPEHHVHYGGKLSQKAKKKEK